MRGFRIREWGLSSPKGHMECRVYAPSHTQWGYMSFIPISHPNEDVNCLVPDGFI
jgi:hypothetical protein